MRSRTVPPVSFSTSGETASAMVLTVLAPIASRTSTIRCITIIAPRGVSGKTWISMSLAATAQTDQHLVAAVGHLEDFVAVLEQRHGARRTDR